MKYELSKVDFEILEQALEGIKESMKKSDQVASYLEEYHPDLNSPLARLAHSEMNYHFNLVEHVFSFMGEQEQDEEMEQYA